MADREDGDLGARLDALGFVLMMALAEGYLQGIEPLQTAKTNRELWLRMLQGTPEMRREAERLLDVVVERVGVRLAGRGLLM